MQQVILQLQFLPQVKVKWKRLVLSEVVAEEETAEEIVLFLKRRLPKPPTRQKSCVESEETTEEEILTGEELDSAIEEDVNALLSGDESLSEEFREKQN